MVKFDAIDMQRFAVSALGALALTAVSVVAAASPARAAAVQTVVKGHNIESRSKPRGEILRGGWSLDPSRSKPRPE